MSKVSLRLAGRVWSGGTFIAMAFVGLALTAAAVPAFLSEKFGLVIGKFNTLIAGEQEFYGNYSTQVLNAAFVFPMTLEQVPLSAYGGGHGIGVFFSAGASDGNPNPIKWAFLAGVGGKGVPGRPDDSYGIGAARTQFSGAFLPLLRDRLGLGLEHEDALEMYYNCAITGWVYATADLQVINQALNRH